MLCRGDGLAQYGVLLADAVAGARIGKLQAAGAGMGVDCHTTICQPFAPLIHTLV
jgi:hypothetical protein